MEESKDESRPSRPGRRGRRTYREYLASRRAAAHQAAHADAETHEPIEIPDHPLIAGDDHELRDAPSHWPQIADQLADASTLAFDTEFIGEASYHPQLCLIQLATEDRVLLIDPLATKDHAPDDLPPALRPVFERLTDDEHLIVVHAGEPDLAFIDRAVGRPPRRVFDTQIAAGFLGHGYPRSLGDLVEALLDVKLPKAMTFTQWDHRPLSETAQHYAGDDVRYLPAMHAALREQLTARGRLGWAEQEFAELSRPERYRFDRGAAIRRIRAAGSLDGRGLATLEKLVELRERAAEEHNLPPRAVLRDKAMVELAREQPQSTEALKQIARLPRPMLGLVPAFLKAVEAAQQIGRDDLPPTLGEPPPPELREKIDRLWKQVRPYCEEHDLDPQLLTNRASFTHFMHRLLRGDPPKQHPLLTGWRATFVAPLRDSWGI